MKYFGSLEDPETIKWIAGQYLTRKESADGG